VPGVLATLDAACDTSGEDGWISWSDPLDGPGPPGPPDTGIPVSATVGVITGTFTSVSTGPGTVTATGGDPVGIGAGSVFKTAGLMPGDVEAPAELSDPGSVCEDAGGLAVETCSWVGTAPGL
jgi:hypothetical protein